MQLNLESKIENIAGIGKKKAELFSKLGVETVFDLLFHVPRKYEKFEFSDLENIELDKNVSLEAVVMGWENNGYRGRKTKLVKGHFDVNGNHLIANWFNQAFLVDRFPEGTKIFLSGKFRQAKYGVSLNNPKIEYRNRNARFAGSIVSIYPETEGLSSYFIGKSVEIALNYIQISGLIPENLEREFGLVSLEKSFQMVHFPRNYWEVEIGRKRLQIEELINFYQKIENKKTKIKKVSSLDLENIKFQSLLENFESKIGFNFTKSQVSVAKDLIADLENKSFTKRLLVGDTGSGKTAVAMLGAFAVFSNSKSSIFLAPNSILINQHFEKAKKVFGNLNLDLIFLTADRKEVWRNGLFSGENHKTALGNGLPKIIFATQAVFFEEINFENIAFLIVDEEQKFGVNQRKKLLKSAFDQTNKLPHFLSMTATPIPRTLMIPLFTDFKLSTIEEKPFESDIRTKVLSESAKPKVLEIVRKVLAEGKQAAVIYPAVESEDISSIQNWFEFWNVGLGEFKVERVFGSMKEVEKNRVIEDFRSQKIDLLVSSTVLEIGVDFPNLAMIVVENAERFGFSTLHQIRGRVGRSGGKGLAVLMSESQDGAEKLKQFASLKNGFDVARLDLQMRGPGDFFGVIQSGKIKFKVVDLMDSEIVELSKEIYQKLKN